MKFENTRVWGFEGALRGMRNPKNSWNKSDTVYGIALNEQEADIRANNWVKLEEDKSNNAFTFISIGENDLKLCQTLIKSGNEHRKFMRQIFVSVDITAPLYWWKEMDQYKVSTTTNSCSTMHKLTSSPITMDMFECDKDNMDFLNVINYCESLRQEYIKTKDKKVWKTLVQTLPNAWLQKRTYTCNYENLISICSKGQRRFHKLNEWSGIDSPEEENFIKWARTLPYAQELIFIDEWKE
jgi:hypothetical protein